MLPMENSAGVSEHQVLPISNREIHKSLEWSINSVQKILSLLTPFDVAVGVQDVDGLRDLYKFYPLIL